MWSLETDTTELFLLLLFRLLLLYKGSPAPLIITWELQLCRSRQWLCIFPRLMVVTVYFYTKSLKAGGSRRDRRMGHPVSLCVHSICLPVCVCVWLSVFTKLFFCVRYFHGEIKIGYSVIITIRESVMLEH